MRAMHMAMFDFFLGHFFGQADVRLRPIRLLTASGPSDLGPLSWSAGIAFSTSDRVIDRRRSRHPSPVTALFTRSESP